MRYKIRIKQKQSKLKERFIGLIAVLVFSFVFPAVLKLTVVPVENKVLGISTDNVVITTVTSTPIPLATTITPTVTSTPMPTAKPVVSNFATKCNQLKAKYPSSDIDMKWFYNNFNERDARILISISVAETRLGSDKNAKATKNPFNYFCKNCNYDKLGWERGIKGMGREIVNSYGKRLTTVNEAEVNKIFVGNGKYCVTGCSNFAKNFMATYNALSD